MGRRHSASILVIYLIYLLALGMTTALLVFWVVVVQRFTPEINQALRNLGVEWSHFHWFIQSTGAGLFFLVIVALTYLLAITLSERRYSRKQQDFLSNITHELKSPVAAIKLHAQTLQQDEGLNESQGRSLGYILGESERVAKLVDNLLESSRLLASGAPPDLEPIHLATFFAEYEQAVQGRFDLGHVELGFEIESQAVVMATSEGLHRVLDNLIDNALRFTSPGGEIRCRVKDAAGMVEIMVADTGIGIPKRDLHRIFDRFYRLGREIRGQRRGTGLGLAIVRGLIEEMSGQIRAVAREDRPGTRFVIKLPQVETAQEGAG